MTRILFLPRVGGMRTSERTPALFRILSSTNDLVTLSADWDRIIYDTTRARWPRYLLYPLDKAILTVRGLALSRRHNSDLVFCETAHHALPGLLVARLRGIACIWDCHGSMKLYAKSVGKGWLYTHLGIALERFIGKRVDAVVTVSDQDVEAFADMGVPVEKMHIVPTCVDLSEVDASLRGGTHTASRKPNSVHPVLLFFGNFRYPPNDDALRFIDAQLAPFLERNGIECEIRIAGRDIPDRPHHRFVRILGFVPNIYDCVRSADVCIVPLWSGQGVKGAVLTKLLDIMAAGTPAVISDYSARGTPGIQHDIHALVASSNEQFLQSVLRIVRDPGIRAAMAKRARELIEQRYEWGRYTPTLNRIVQAAVASRSNGR